MISPAAVMVGGRLAVFSGRPVVSLLDALSPLRWRIPARLSLRLAFASLHDDSVQVRHHFFLDIGDAAAGAAQGAQVRLVVWRFCAGECDNRIKALCWSDSGLIGVSPRIQSK